MSENDYTEMTERERMEARAIASLLGEASPFEEAALEDAMAKDEELKRFVEDMRKTISWVESTETETKRGGAGVGGRGPRLAWSRRWRLKRAFRSAKSERNEAVAPMPNRNVQIRGLISIAACLIVSIVTLVRWPAPSFLLEGVAPKVGSAPSSELAPGQRGFVDSYFEQAGGAETRKLGRTLQESEEPVSGPQSNRFRFDYFKRSVESEPAMEAPAMSTLDSVPRERLNDGLASESRSEPASEFALGFEMNSPAEEAKPAASPGVEDESVTFESLSRRSSRPEGDVTEFVTRSRAFPPSRRAGAEVEDFESTLEGDRAISRNAPRDRGENGRLGERRAFGGVPSSEVPNSTRGGGVAGRARGRGELDASDSNPWGSTPSADDFISLNGVADFDADTLVDGDATTNFSGVERFGITDKSLGLSVTGPMEGMAVDGNGEDRERRSREIADPVAAIEDSRASTASNDFSFSADSGMPAVATVDESPAEEAPGQSETTAGAYMGMKPEMMAMYGYGPGMMTPGMAGFDADESGDGVQSSEGGIPDASVWMESGAAFGRSTSSANGGDAGLGGVAGGGGAGFGGGAYDAGAARGESNAYFGGGGNSADSSVHFDLETSPAAPPVAGEPVGEDGARYLWSMPDTSADYGVEYEDAPAAAPSDLSLDAIGQESAELEEIERRLGTELQSSTAVSGERGVDNRVQDQRLYRQFGEIEEAESIPNKALTPEPSNTTAQRDSNRAKERQQQQGLEESVAESESMLEIQRAKTFPKKLFESKDAIAEEGEVVEERLLENSRELKQLQAVPMDGAPQAEGRASTVRGLQVDGEQVDAVHSVELADQDAVDSLSLSLNKKSKEGEPSDGATMLGDLVVDAPVNKFFRNDRVGVGAGTSPSFTSPIPNGSPSGIAGRPEIENELDAKEAEVVGKMATLEDEIALKRRAKKAPEPEISFEETLTEDEPFATFSLNVSDVSFKTTEASLNEGQIPDPEQIRPEEFVNAFDYRESWDDSDGALAMVWDLARNPLEHRRDILRILMRTESEGRSAEQPINLVVLLDNSGSMDREDRREIVDASLKTLAANLRPTDQVSFMTFAREPRLWVDRAPGGKPDQLLNQTLGHQPGGATNLELALDSAYQVAESGFLPEGKNRVLLMTDGAANLGDIDPDRLREMVANRRRQGIALDCFGIGWTDYEDALLEALARNGDGRYGFLNDVDKAESEFGDQLLGALRVAAEDVKVQVEFNPERVASYRQMGYRNHRLKKEDFRNNAIDAAEIAAEEVGTALFVIEQRADGRGPIATVRARYRDPDTKDYSEQEWSILATGATTRLEDASPNMRLAASAALFAEWLEKGAPMGSDALELVDDLSRDFPEVFGGADRPQRLLSMTRIARDIVSSR